jgi:DNA polymerase I
MCWRNLFTGETGECTDYETIKAFLDDHKDSIFVGHNILKFDGPVLNRLAGSSTKLGPRNCIDTLVLSTLYSPSLDGGHSLDSWGKRLGELKTEFNDWGGGLSPAMIKYCHQDVLVTAKLFVRLINTLQRIEFSEQSIWIQHNLTSIIHQQQMNGFYFNYEGALSLYSELRHLEKELENEVRDVFPSTQHLVREASIRRKDGQPTAIFLKDQERYCCDIDNSRGVYSAYEDVEFNLGSPKQRVDKLLSLGWQPRTFTEKGSPRPFEHGDLSPCLAEFLEENPMPEVLLIARWMAYNGRANMVNTWMENYNHDTHCIHGRLFVADTLRFRHQSPNTANIPAVRTVKEAIGGVSREVPLLHENGLYTYESRNLWCARPERVLVGTDAAGLELRMLAHYLNRAGFTEQVLSGDPHQYNADLVGITRPQAKTLLYAIMYGAGDAKVGRIMGLPILKNKAGYDISPEGGKVKNLFLETLGISDLVEECKNEQQRGRVTLCDGSKVVCPSPHAALNYRLQGSGARVMGLGAILLEKTIRRLELDSLKVGDIHDEWQYDVYPDHAECHAREAVQAIRDAGKYLRLNIPLDGTSKQGYTWAETH